MTNSKQRISYRILFLLFAVLYFVLCFQNLPQVFSSVGIILPGTDPYYRMHRIVSVVNGSWRYPLFEPLLNFPVGWNVAWPLGFDYILALPAKILGIHDERDIMIIASMMIPVLTYGFPFFITASVTKKSNRWVGLIAGVCIVCTTIPSYSGVGQIDHHIIDAFFVFLGFYLMAKLRDSNHPWDSIAFVLLCGLSPCISPHGWLVSALVLINLLFMDDRFQNKMSELFLYAFLISLFTLSFSDRFWNGYVSIAGFSWWSSYILILASFLIRIGACIGRKKIGKLDVCVFILFLTTTLFLSIKSGFFMWNELVNSFNWLFRNGSSGTLSQTIESQSAFSTIGQYSKDIWFLYAAPLVIGWFIIRKKHVVLTVYLIILSILAFIQIRFLLMALPFLIVGITLGIFELVSKIFHQKYAIVATFILIMICGLPRLGFSSKNIPRDEFFSVRQASKFIKQLVEEEHGEIAKSGTIARWDFGHWIGFYAHSPVVSSPFQEPSARDVEELFASENSDQMDLFVQKYPARFLMVDESFPQFWATLKLSGKNPEEYFVQTKKESEVDFSTKEKFENVFYYRYLHRLGEDPDGNSSKHWRLVFVSPFTSKFSYGLSALKTFEYVPGVEITMKSNVKDLWIETKVYEEKDHVTHISRQKSVIENGVHHWHVPYAAYQREGVVSDGVYKIMNSEKKVLANLPAIQEDQVVHGDHIVVSSKNP